MVTAPGAVRIQSRLATTGQSPSGYSHVAQREPTKPREGAKQHHGARPAAPAWTPQSEPGRVHPPMTVWEVHDKKDPTHKSAPSVSASEQPAKAPSDSAEAPSGTAELPAKATPPAETPLAGTAEKLPDADPATRGEAAEPGIRSSQAPQEASALPPDSDEIHVELSWGSSNDSPYPDDRLGEGVDGLLLDIDAGFDCIVQKPDAAPASASVHVALTEEQNHEVRGLFAQIAAGHMRPVRDFVIEVKLGEPQREWIDLIRPAVGSLRKAAEGMGMGELCKATDDFLAALDLAADTPAPRIKGDTRELLISAYDGLTEVMPEAFKLNEEQDRREPVIVQSLLRQVPGVRKVAMDKLYAAGLTRLEMYYVAKPYDVAQAAGLKDDLAEKIVRRFAQYRQEASVAAPDLERSHEHRRLAVLTAKLAQQNEAFMTASKSLSAQAARDKRRVRQERNQTVLEINVLLARLGEVQLVAELEKSPFQGKVESVRAWLERAKARVAGSGKTGA
ncbi:MAG: hypothetical protein MUF54_13240 [Polyangiaceae bacterium]|jgi:hypothetical protein|nr:hypothetical protein [Polyangiaceae bacterium]